MEWTQTETNHQDREYKSNPPKRLSSRNTHQPIRINTKTNITNKNSSSNTQSKISLLPTRNLIFLELKRKTKWRCVKTRFKDLQTKSQRLSGLKL